MLFATQCGKRLERNKEGKKTISIGLDDGCADCGGTAGSDNSVYSIGRRDLGSFGKSGAPDS